MQVYGKVYSQVQKKHHTARGTDNYKLLEACKNEADNMKTYGTKSKPS